MWLSLIFQLFLFSNYFTSGHGVRNKANRNFEQFDVGQNHEDLDDIFRENNKAISYQDDVGQSHMNFDFNDFPHQKQKDSDLLQVGQQHEDIGQKNDFSLDGTLEDPAALGQKYEEFNFWSKPKKPMKTFGESEPFRGDQGQEHEAIPVQTNLLQDFEQIHFGKSKMPSTEDPLADNDMDFGQQHMEDIFPMQDDGQTLIFPDFPGGVVQKKPISAGSSFRGGCNNRPPTPMNAVLKCSLYSGCKATCQKGHEFPGGELTLFMTCKAGEWKIGGDTWQVVPPCRPICLPACQNNGICIAPNQCQCPKNYGGPQCQFEKKPCLNNVPLPANSMRSCSSTSCTVTCARGFTFPDGSSITNLVCKDGQWRLSRSDWVSLPDCRPVCDPPCINGGSCLSLNICQCPQAFTGPQCQYEMSACSGEKLNFNGIHNCSGNGDRLVCELRCPPSIEPSSPIAKEYTCLYSSGKFSPTPIPSCVYGDDVLVIPLNSSSNTFYSASQIERGTYHSKHPSKGTKQSKQVSLDIVNLFEGNFKPSPGECFVWGNTHIKNFDGGMFSFNSPCSFVFSKDVIDGSFEIAIKNEYCSGSNCNRYVDILYQNSKYSLTSADNSPQLLVDGKLISMPTQLAGFTAEISPAFTLIHLHSLDLSLKWNNKDFISLAVNENMWNRTGGLCGNINKITADDYYTKSGAPARSLETFLESWSIGDRSDSCTDAIKVNSPCNDSNAIPSHCQLLLSDPHFVTCREVVNVKPFHEACLWDSCTCGSSCSCTTVEAFVRQCKLHLGNPVSNWRVLSGCPYFCSSPKIYSSCGKVYQARCGDGQVEADAELQPGGSSTGEECVEGCYCPPNTVLDGNDCVPMEMCSCQLRGKTFAAGSTVPKGCNTCTCTNGRWTCTEAQCGARCSSLGDPHYVTFDGRRFDFMGQCSYYLVKADNFSIEAENVPCSGSISKAMGMIPGPDVPTCTKAVNIKLNHRTIRLKQSSQVLVNNEEVEAFPHQDEGFAIRTVSSLFLMVSLDNGVDIWWDGITSVYVDVPATMQGQTAGLCGKFNLNQKDDFLTPEGDIEQGVVPFANKWKTQESCREVVDKVLDHPCDRDPLRREKALSLCNKLKSSIFKTCHWYVDVEIHYQNCLFDLCSCATDVKSCFCPVLADYAAECAREGVPIVWRSDVRECGLHCTGGQTYQACGDVCSRSCQDISMFPSCRRRCVEGCNCPAGQTLDSSGVCIPIAQCPCLHHNREYNAGSQLVMENYKGPQFCTCGNAQWDCRQATSDEVSKHSEIEGIKLKCLAVRNEQFTYCEPSEPITCKNMHSPPQHSPAKCVPGCICKAGYVWDSIEKRCVKATECPCHHGGISYGNGSTIQQDCNTCSCNSGKWQCTDRSCPAICSFWGDSHIKTYDGKMFDFQGSCDFLLSGGVLSDHDVFDVIIQIVPCGTSGISCPKSVTLKVGKNDDTEQITLVKGRPLPPNQSFKRISIREVGIFVFVEVFDLGLLLQWDKNTQIYIKADPKWRNKVKGLCGNMNNDVLDDFNTPSGGISEVSQVVFADSWKLHPYCPESTEIKNPCEYNPHRRNWAVAKCGVLKSPVFKACHSEVPLDDYIERCVLDTCGCDEGGDCECLCSAIAAYAQACSLRGVPIKWRSQDLCPMQCDKLGSKYTSCISPCPLKTCDNVLIHNGLTRICGEESCVEGCEPPTCPEGMIFVNATFIECVPPSKCKTTCMTVGNITYFEGDLMEGDDCHSCYCSHHKKVCSGVACTTQQLTTTETILATAPNDVQPTCVPGWSSWINLDHPIPEKKKTDYEPLPSFDTLLLLGSPAHCNESQIADIRCRESWDLTHYKETGFDVECGLIEGLKCESSTLPCPDFEISVLCECHDAVTTSTTKHTTTTTTTPSAPVAPCPIGEKWVECAIPCNQTCHFFGHYLINRGLCSSPDFCLPGCQLESWVPCESGKWLRDAQTCVSKKDCTCRSDSGDMIKPGLISHESECGKCQCINNQYECDFADCFEKATRPPPTTPTTRQDRNLFNVTLPQVIRKDFGNVTIIYLTTPSTVTPPPKCLISKYYSLVRNNKGAQLSSSSDRDFQTAAAEGRLENVKKSWMAGRDNMDQYLQVDLGEIDIVYGVVVAGDISGNYVTSYRLLYSLDGVTYRYISTPDSINEVFRGPIDGKHPVKQILNNPIEARFVRFNPFSWHGAIAMRVDVLGCGGEVEATTEWEHIITSAPPICDQPMGLDSGMLPVEAVTGSSAKPGHAFSQVRLSSESAWKPMTSSQLEYLMIDLLALRNLTGIETLGTPQGNNIDSFIPESWVESYRLKYSQDKLDWNPILDNFGKEKIFLGNFDGDSPKKNWFDRPIKARYIKFMPLTWRHEISVRLELFGCFEPYPTSVPSTVTTHAPTSPLPCQVCPGVEVSSFCYCMGESWWNGEECISRAECPCTVGHMTYAVGSIFHKENCEECICRLNGIASCSVKDCNLLCPHNQRSVLTPSCSCVCKQCDVGTQLCPTSGVCISQSSWCDGVQDCPDDESDCPVDVEEPMKPCNTTCPPGYAVMFTSENQEVEIFETSQFLAAKKGTKKKGVKSTKGTKSVKRPVKYARHHCPPYECVPLPTIPPTECPQPACPRNFTVETKVVGVELLACPRFVCRPPTERAVCSFSGRTFKTFDNVEYKFDVCDHILATDTNSGDWNVSVFKTCKTMAPCAIGVVINHNGRNLNLMEGNNIEVDGFNYSNDQISVINSHTKEFNINRMGQSWFFISHVHGFNVTLDDAGSVSIEVTGDLKGSTNGLCGLYNGLSDDDKTSPSGKLIHLTNEFGKSWMTPGSGHCDTQVCPIALQEKALSLCFDVKKEPFTSCHEKVNVNKFISRCLESTCACLQSNKTADECRCLSLLQFVTTCKAADITKDFSGWRLTHDCAVSCPADMTFHDCYPYDCESSCQEQSCLAPASSCFSGCFCADGYVRSGEKCVKPTECYNCVCEGLGDSNYLDFNGNNFIFNGNCSYVASRIVTPSGGYDLQVIVTNRPCLDGSNTQCTDEVSVFLRSHKITLKNKNAGETAVEVDNLEVSELPYNTSWVLVERVIGAAIHVLLPKYSVHISFHYPRFSVSLPSSKYHHQTEGLCGNCIGGPRENDKKIETKDMGQVWLVESLSKHCEAPKIECNETKDIPEACSTILGAQFAKCHPLVDPVTYISFCKTSICHNGSFCHSIEAYAKACRDVGICIDWRTKDLCPMQCSQGLVYSPCALGCPLTCETIEKRPFKTDSCPFKNVEGCICPENHVLVNNTCVNARWCEPCDSEGHHSGDSWMKDQCTNCTCEGQTVRCNHEECAAKETLCSEGYSPIEDNSDISGCCAKFICVPNPTKAPLQCPDTIQPECGYGQLLKLEIDDTGCPRYVCRCKLAAECDELPQMDEQVLPIGMERHVNTSGCCPRSQIICNVAFCPLPTDCPQFYKTVTIPATDCCPTYRCDKTTDICLYEMRNGDQAIVQKVGSEWYDGPCKMCKCLLKDGQAEVSCLEKECLPMESHLEYVNYDLEAQISDDVCCPTFRRVACKVNETIYRVGTSWFPNNNDKCVSAHCVRNENGEVTKELKTENCKTDCESGWSYQPSNASCCGQCIQTKCILGDKLYSPGESWLSFDNCTTYSCRFVLGGYLVTSEAEKCPDLSDCPIENHYQDGCCSRCKLVPPALSNCAPTEIPALDTIELIQEHQTYHGKCTNQSPIPGFTECTGACDSHTIFNKATWGHDNVCQCCQATGYSKLKVPLTCNDGYIIEKTVSIPTKCSCQSCGAP